MSAMRIFEVVDIRDLAGDGSRLLVRGRTYDNIEVGDIVYPENLDGSVRDGQPLVIVEMSSYGRPTPILSRTMTGDVTVQGRSGDDLAHVKYLLRGEKVT
jgi:hypothetical protein